MCLIGKTQLLCMQCREIGPHPVARAKSHPDVANMTAEKANKALTDAGLNVRLDGATLGGEAIVYSQSVAPGTIVAKGTIVEIEMRYVGIYGDE